MLCNYWIINCFNQHNFKHVEQPFDYPSAIRKIIYTTNAIELVNSSFRMLTKKGAFPNENALFKLLYLRVAKLIKNGRISPELVYG